MNHIETIKKWADDKLMAEIARIEAEQAPEILKAIFNAYKDDMLIKWKTDAFKIIQSAQKQPEKNRVPKKEGLLN